MPLGALEGKGAVAGGDGDGGGCGGGSVPDIGKDSSPHFLEASERLLGRLVGALSLWTKQWTLGEVAGAVSGIFSSPPPPPAHSPAREGNTGDWGDSALRVLLLTLAGHGATVGTIDAPPLALLAIGLDGARRGGYSLPATSEFAEVWAGLARAGDNRAGQLSPSVLAGLTAVLRTVEAVGDERTGANTGETRAGSKPSDGSRSEEKVPGSIYVTDYEPSLDHVVTTTAWSVEEPEDRKT